MNTLHFIFCLLLWIGIILTAVGSIGSQVIGNKIEQKKEDNYSERIEKLTTQNTELIDGKNELIEKIEQYQKTADEKDKVIDKLKNEVNELSITSPKLLPDGRIAASPYVTMASEFSDGINRARDLFNNGNYDDAYIIAEDLKKKKPDFGLAFFILGTIDVQRGNTVQGKQYLEQSLQLELPDSDRAWAFHNLSIVALQSQDIDLAIKYLKQAIQINPKMEESKKMLKSIEDQLNK